MGKINDGWKGDEPKRKLKVGEKLQFMAGNRKLTIERTSREYIYDLCDAYNEARTKSDLAWYVAGEGDGAYLCLGVPEFVITARARALDRAAENDRERWKAMHNAPRDYF